MCSSDLAEINDARHQVISSLESDGYCKDLSTEQRDGILKQFKLDEEFSVIAGNDDEIFAQLRKTPLVSFDSKVRLILSDIPKIKEKIAKMLEPETVMVSLDSPVTIKSVEELETYLSSIRANAKEALDAGNPVMLR